MFKRIQNYLLLNHPLLWNVKIVPLTIVMLSLHILFFVIGYVNGAIDFSESNDLYNYDSIDGIVIFISIFLSILIGVIWLVFYFRNNAFKSFYPNKNGSLYKEWLLLLVICLLNFSYSASFLYAKDLRARNYFSEQEFVKRVDIISMASLFAEGSFESDGDSIFEKNGETIRIHKDSIRYGNRSYQLNSLLNKSIFNFSYQRETKDSLNTIRVKNWLVNNQKDSVFWVMSEFNKIAKGHKAVGNVTANQWLNHVYDYPEFTKYITVGRNYRTPQDEPIEDMYVESDYASTDPNPNNQTAKRIQDTVSNDIKIVNGRTYIYPKYHVPLKQIEKAYEKISQAWVNPDLDSGLLTFYFYFGLVFSLLIFSFRVTSGRSWLIAILAFGILALVSGILNLMFSEFFFPRTLYRNYNEYIYFGFWIVFVTVMLVYFYSYKKAKGQTGIVVNLLLWLTPWILPVLIMFANKYIQDSIIFKDGIRVTPKSTLEIWLQNYPGEIMCLNILVFIVFMYFFTISIKKWKGVAEA